MFFICLFPVAFKDVENACLLDTGSAGGALLLQNLGEDFLP